MTLQKRTTHPLHFITILLLVLLIGWFAGTPRGRAQVKATLLVVDLLTMSDTSLLHTFTKRATSQQVSISSPADTIKAQIYQPAGNDIHGALILVLGYPSNISDPQLNRLADSLARLGIVTVIPQLKELRTGLITPQDVDALVATFQWTAEQPFLADGHVGFNGFCVGSSLSLLAAQDAQINQDVALINVFGGYFDLPSLLHATATHTAVYENRQQTWHPSNQTVSLFVQNVLHYVESPTDKALLSKHLREGVLTSSEIEQFSEVGKIAYGLFTSSDPTEVSQLLDQIPEETAVKMAQVSPQTNISQLQAKLFIMHDVSDPYIPVTESYRLGDAITNPTQKVQADFVLFEHVRPDHSMRTVTKIREGLRLIHYLSQLIMDITP